MRVLTFLDTFPTENATRNEDLRISVAFPEENVPGIAQNCILSAFLIDNAREMLFLAIFAHFR